MEMRGRGCSCAKALRWAEPVYSRNIGRLCCREKGERGGCMGGPGPSPGPARPLMGCRFLTKGNWKVETEESDSCFAELPGWPREE